MKKSTNQPAVCTLITTALLTASLQTWAQAPSPEGDPSDRRARFLERYDLDGAGNVTPEEIREVRAQAAAERVAHFIEKHDLNQDGIITPDELVMAATEKAAEKQSELLVKFDLNSDGTITTAESLSVHEERVEEHIAKILERINNPDPNQGDNAPEGRQRRGNRPPLDLDGDGTVTEEEALVAGATRVLELQAKFNERFDTNGDGVITESEISTLSDTAIMERVEALLAKLDANEDGQITADEVAESRPGRKGKQVGEEGNRGPRRGPRQGNQIQADAGNGQVNPSAAPQRQQRPQGRRSGPRQGGPRRGR